MLNSRNRGTITVVIVKEMEGRPRFVAVLAKIKGTDPRHMHISKTELITCVDELDAEKMI